MAAFSNEDGGWTSRKLLLTVFTQALIFVSAILAGRFGLLGPNFETLVGGLIGVLALYLGGNLGAKHFTGKNILGLGDKAVDFLNQTQDTTVVEEKSTEEKVIQEKQP